MSAAMADARDRFRLGLQSLDRVCAAIARRPGQAGPHRFGREPAEKRRQHEPLLLEREPNHSWVHRRIFA